MTLIVKIGGSLFSFLKIFFKLVILFVRSIESFETLASLLWSRNCLSKVETGLPVSRNKISCSVLPNITTSVKSGFLAYLLLFFCSFFFLVSFFCLALTELFFRSALAKLAFSPLRIKINTIKYLNRIIIKKKINLPYS